MNLRKIEIIRRFFSKTCNDDDLENLFLLLNSKKGHDEINNILDTDWNSFECDDTMINTDSGKMFKNIKNGIRRNELMKMNKLFIRRLSYAAAIITIIGLTIFIVLNSPFSGQYDADRYTSVITEKGQRSKVILPDSSIVWLNSDTKLSYNYSSKNKRVVTLKGQGFFSVAHNEKRPFIVTCGDIKVNVLGTKFDVSAYPGDDKISVALQSGKVLLNDDRRTLDLKLTSGEVADYNVKERKVNIHKESVKELTSWKNGELRFKNEPMKLVIKKLERWYNIEIEVKDPEVYKSVFTGAVLNKSYEQIFKLIEYSCPVNFDVVNNFNLKEKPKVVLSGNN